MQFRIRPILLVICIVMVLWFITAFSCLKDDIIPSKPGSRYIAYYQTDGHHSLALRVVLDLLHRVYPSMRVCLYIDSPGTNKKLLPQVQTHLVKINILPFKQGATKKGLHFNTVHAAEMYIQRLQATASMKSNGWVFLVEDDVWAIQAVPEEALRYDISGTCWAYYRAEYSVIIKNQTGHCYGGYGGHFVNSSRLLGLSSKCFRPLITELLAAYNPIASDELLSAVILQDGGTIGYYTGYYEKLVGNGPLMTQHQMKMFYNW